MQGSKFLSGQSRIEMSPNTPEYVLDELDEKIIAHLQYDARNTTAVDIAEDLGVTDSTVRNRISNLENRGIITNYIPLIDYQKAGYPFFVTAQCSADMIRREELAEKALDIPGVIMVRELMSGSNNVEVSMIGASDEDITNIARKLHELDMEVGGETLIRNYQVKMFGKTLEDIGSEAE